MSRTLKSAMLFSVLLGLTVAQPLTVSLAAAPNAINNQTAQLVSPERNELGQPVPGHIVPRGVGIYDGFDAYRGPNGFPLPGDSQLFEPVD